MVRAKFPQRETDGCKMGRAKLKSADCREEKCGTETGKAKLAWKSNGGEVGVRSGLGVKKGCTLEFVHERHPNQAAGLQSSCAGEGILRTN